MPPHLIYARARASKDDPYCPVFLEACKRNDVDAALQLVSGYEAELLTFGLNHAFENKYLDLASRLLQVGAKWDTRTARIVAGDHNSVQ